ncbi:SDR family NAD(P)-dependent oxidoreductase [Lentzea sp. NPDC055074]
MLLSELIRPLPELLLARAERHGDKVAFRDSRRGVGYAELERRTASLAGHLAGRGDTVLILLGNCVEFVESFFAVTRAGAVGVPVNPQCADAELDHFVRDSGARVVITDRANAARARRIAAGATVVVVGEQFEEWATNPVGPAPDSLGLDDVAWLLYTSGTTGKPKGVLSTQRSCLWSVAACYAPILGLSEEDEVLWPLPLYHSLAHIMCLLGVMATGASARVMAGFSAEEVASSLGTSTVLAGVPTMYHYLLRDGAADLSGLRVALCTGAPATGALRTEFAEKFGVPLIDSYGSTETCGAITMNAPDAPVVPGSCGTPVPGTSVRLVNPETLDDVPAGTEGEVWVSGPSLMLGYHGLPEQTAAAMPDGWYRTGDLARFDENGYLHITGRLKDLIIRAGENIHPAEIEDVLRGVPGVADVAVAGHPDPVFGEVPVAHVVPEPGGVAPGDLLRAAREGVAHFKVPEYFYEVTSIPRTGSGKVRRHALASSPGRLIGTRGPRHESLSHVSWLPVEPVESASPDVVVVGADSLGLSVPVYSDLAAIEFLPDVVLVPCFFDAIEGGDFAGAVAATTEFVHDMAARWLAEERFASARLVFVTRRVVFAVPGDDVSGLVPALVWGVVRAAMTGHEDRFGLVDLDDAPIGPELPAALAAGENRLAVRDGRLLAPRLSALVTPETATPGLGGTVLVVGPVAGAGGEIARHLAGAHDVRELVVLDPSPSEVDSLVADVAALGATVNVLPVSAADPAALAPALPASLSAVVHAAELAEGRVDPVLNLHVMTRTLPLNAFVVLSSLVPTIGGTEPLGQVAAHAFLDVIAQHRRAQGIPGLALAGPFSTGALDLALASGHSLVLNAQADAVALPAVSTGTSARDLLALVRAEVAAILGREVGADASFTSYGIDSRSAVVLRNRLVEATGAALPVTAAFDHPTPALLAEELNHLLSGTSRAEEQHDEADLGEPIAIIGMSCRYPGAGSPEELWRLVAEGRDAVGEFPDDRGWPDLYDPDPDAAGRSYVRHGGFLRDAGEFDPGFFGISPREALAMDPQQRLLLETSWEVFERAGITPEQVKGSRTGVFTGVMFHDYASGVSRPPEDLEGYLGTGGAGSVASGRVSYTFGLQGPAVTVDTACSSSLVALHLAAQSLRTGESSMALAGGVAVMATPSVFVEFSRQRGLAADGRCRSFADSADGTAWGEGVGVLLLERLSDARRNGHRVLAVVRGSAVNQDGASNGLTAPSGPSQQRVIRQALRRAGLSTSDVDAVEAHGTGTTLGDPIEAQAIIATYGQQRSTPLWLGSLKSNIGHTQAAAGVGGVIKMIMAMRHGVLPKTLHVDTPTSHVDWSAGAVSLLTEAREWPQVDRPRRAAVSSFGVSGTNAHVILEGVAAETGSASSSGPVPWVLSGRTEQVVREQAARLRDHLAAHEVSAADVGFTLAGRASFEHRAVVFDAESLSTVASGGTARSVVRGVARGDAEVAFVFPGQGSQWVGMAEELAEASPVFRTRLDECAEALAPYVELDLRETERVDVVQPALWAVMVSLAEVWRSFGVEPQVVIGHSQGEIAAAVVAGVLSIEDGAKVVALRSQAIARSLAGRGGMVSVQLPLDEVRELIGDRLSIAAVNGPASVVVSGDVDALDELLASCDRARRVPVDYASHSAHVELIESELLELLDVSPRTGSVPFFSTVTGEYETELDAGYWYRNLRQTVRFDETVRALEGHAFIEVSAHPVLVPGMQDATAVGTLRRDEGGPARVLRSVAEAHVAGVRVEWPLEGALVDLPTYPFQRERFWLESDALAGDPAGLGQVDAEHPLLGAAVTVADDGGMLFTGVLSTRTHPWLADHSVLGSVILPGSAFVELALHAGAEVGSDLLEELTFETPLVLDEAPVPVQVLLSAPDDAGRRRISVHSRADDTWVRHAIGSLATEPAPAAVSATPPADAEPFDVNDFYDRLADRGFDYGPAFHGLHRAWRHGGDVYAHVRLADAERGEAARFGLHPALLDAALHAMTFTAAGHEAGEGRLAFAWSDVRLHATGAEELLVRLTAHGEDSISVQAADPSGRPVLSAASVTVRPASPAGVRPARSLFRVDWVPATRESAGPSEHALVPLTFASSGHLPADVRAAVTETLELLRDKLSGTDTLVFTTRFAAAVRDEVPDLVQAAVNGLLRTAQSEHPGRIVLADLDDDPASAEALGAAVATGETQVAIRAGEVLAARLVRADAGEPVRLDPEGTVLVTGATGGLGRLVARHLVTAHGVRNLLLTSRRAADLGDLADLDATITFAECDVADRDSLAALLATIPAEHPLTGVVHTAGVVDDGVLVSLTGDQVDRVLRPKVDAAIHLHELTAGLDLPLFALYSSAAAVFGAPGQGNYAAANAFLDAFAAHRRASGRSAVALAWGLWAEEAGMGGRLSDTDVRRMARGGTAPLAAQEGLALFSAALAGPNAAVVPIRLDRASLRDNDVPPLLRDLVPARRTRTATGGDLAGQLRGLSEVDGDRLLVDLVRAHAAAVLGHASAEQVDVDQSFKELGFDSLTAVELRNRLSTPTGLRLPPTLIFNYPTVTALAVYLRTALSEAPARVVAPVAAQATEAEPIAIVAIGCRFPGDVRSPEDLWRLVADGGDAISALPVDRGWDLDALFDADADKQGTSYVREGGFLHDVAEFDAGFFGISPREALAMDPQQRLLLETSWEALERAGIAPDSLRGSDTGVFAGTHGQDYAALLSPPPEGLEGYLVTGNAASVVSGRIAYTFGLEGPAVTVDTACSSSLVALHLATQSLRRGECSLALAGAASVMSTPEGLVAFSRQRGLAADGRSKAFAAAADGFGMSEGVGVLVLERLSDARRNGHPVLAVVRGTAVNQDGASNGLTAPNGPSQERVIRAALASAGLSTSDVDVVEAHGTGTRLGDPIEAHALLATYGQDRAEPLLLGSVKSNLGHTQAAAGLAGVIKMVMAMRHGVLPKTLHVDAPSEHVDWSAGSIELLTEPREWPADRPRRAGVSAFGVSGTNAHVIIEGEPAEEPGADDALVPLVLSAKSDESLREQAERLREKLADPRISLPGVARTLVDARARFDHRAVVVGHRHELLDGLAVLAAGEPGATKGVAPRGGRPVAFLFPGQGSQWVGMAEELAEASPVFAKRLQECAEALAPYVELDLRETERVDVVQPALWAVMVSLAEVWRSFGVEPDVVVGHSQGEIAAAVVAGVLSLEDGAKVVALRSQAIARSLAGKGGMVSVQLPLDEVRGLIDERLSIAAVNGPSAVVVSGDVDALDELLASCDRARRVPVDYASHSSHVELVEPELSALLRVAPKPGPVPFLSTVTGRYETDLDAGYWYRNLRQTVRLDAALSALDGHAFIEVSAHPVLATGIQDAVGTLRRDDGGLDRMLRSAGEAFVHGVPVVWPRQDAPLADVPTYAFQRERFWVTAPVKAGESAHPLLSADTEIPEIGGFVATGRISRHTHPWLADEAVLAAAFAELALWAGGGGTLEEFTITTPALLPEAGSTHLQVWVGAADERGRRPVGVHTRGDDEWTRNASGVLVPDVAPATTSSDGTELTLPDEHDPTGFLIHPVLLAEAVGGVAGTWRGLRLHAPGTSSVRIRSAVGLEITDLDGRPVLSADSVVLRERSAVTDSLFGIDWVPAEATAPPSCSVIGPDHFGLEEALRAQGVVLSDDAEVAVVACGGPGNDLVPDAHDAVHQTLALMRDWLATREGRLVLVTRGAVATGPGEDVPDLAHAPIWGLVRSAQSEHPGRFTIVDADDVDALAQALGSDEPQVAVRDGKLLVPRLAPVAAHRIEPGAFDGTVLVTGATGTLGALVTRHLVTEHGARDLLLLSRSGAAEGLAAELTDLGARVAFGACDVTDRTSLEKALLGHRLSAVVHVAGTVDDGVLDSLTSEQVERVLRPKVDAAVHLHELAGDVKAFVLFSSAAGVFGGPGQANYAAANTFLDALAQHRHARGLPATSLAWGLWEERSELTGVLDDADVARLARRGTVALSTQEGLALFDAALGSGRAAVVPVRLDRAAVREQGTVPSILRGLVRATKTRRTADNSLSHRLGTLTGQEQLRELVGLVRANAAAVLGHADATGVATDRAFRELGFDSLTAVELRNRLQTVAGVPLPATIVFDHPTAAALGAELRTRMLGETVRAEDTRSVATTGDPIAIVAMNCRYPGGISSPDDLWALLAEGGDAISEFPGDRGWDVGALYDPDPERSGTSYVRHGGFLRDAGHFDPAFFGISPREAAVMDPQQRLLLETSWEAFERGGIDPRTLKGSRTGVFTGISGQDYATLAVHVAPGDEGYLATSTGASVISGRVSYAFGLEGPAVTVDTACSSSLVALHLASQALRNGECDLALASGVTVMATPSVFVAFSRQRGLAEDGRSKAFAASADGFGMAEGVGVLVLERLSDARRNGHWVLALVKGSAVNQDGASNGLTAPNGPAQQKVIRQALQSAGLSTSDVDAVEAHGTGTKLGDPIEAQAIIATYGQDRDQPLWLGSVKSNIGHTLAAAGVAGVMKMVLAMRHGVLPKTLHVDEPSPHVDWSEGAVELATDAVSWPRTGRPRRAGVSSFGISGTNAHVILEGVEPEARPSTPDSGPVAWVLSGHTEEALRAQAARLREVDAGVADVALSLVSTRAALTHRAVVVGDRDGLRAGLASLAEGKRAVNTALGRQSDAPLAFLFTGQGAQRAGMGQELHARFPVFAAAFDEVWSRFSVDHLDVDDTGHAQPAIFALEVALHRLLESFGVRPDHLAGHSIGEIAAAHVAGVLSLDDACTLVGERARLMQALPRGGAMVSLVAAEDEVLPLLTGHVSIAAVNGPRSVVIAGAEDEVLAVAGHFEKTKRLKVSHAFHSPLMEPVLDEFREVVRGLTFSAPRIPLAASGDVTDPEYWVRHVRDAVRFADNVASLGDCTFVEIGPDGILSAMVDGAIPTLRRNRSEVEALLLALGRVHVAGTEVAWSEVYPGAQVVDLPTYAFQRARYWLDAPESRAEERVRSDWRYRVDWTPVVTGSAARTDRWLVDPSLAGVVGGTPLDLGGDRATVAERLRAAGPADGVLVAAESVEQTLAVVQGFADSGVESKLWVATRGAVSVSEEDVLGDPDAARVWGLGIVAGLELPARWGGLVDLPADVDPGVLRRVLAGSEDQVAIRATGVHARRLHRAPLAAAGDWKARGTVLITGGTGALAGHVARWLARSGAEHLVLLSRRGADAPGAAELRDELGVRVTFAACDVTDLDALRNLVDEVGPVHAVVHTAGVGDRASLAETTPEEFAEVMRAKVIGARNLDEVFGELDAFVLFSSAAAVWGGGNQSAYAAANAYLDALAVHRRQRGLTATSVAWGLWAGGGMGDGADQQQLHKRGMRAMAPELAMSALRDALAAGETSVVVGDMEWERFVPSFTVARPSPLLSELVAQVAEEPVTTSGAPLRDLVLAAGPDDRERVLVDEVRATAAAVLGYSSPAEVDVSRGLLDLGFDSLTAVELRNQLAAATGLKLAATLVFDHPSVTAIARFLSGELAGGEVSVLDELDRLESLLAVASVNGSAHEVETRLTRLLATWRGARGLDEVDLGSASVDEVLEFIDELGLS